jgi:hypothetical protein
MAQTVTMAARSFCNRLKKLVDRRLGHGSGESAEQAIRVGQQILRIAPEFAKHLGGAAVLGIFRRCTGRRLPRPRLPRWRRLGAGGSECRHLLDPSVAIIAGQETGTRYRAARGFFHVT